MTRQNTTPVHALHAGDTVRYQGTRRTVIRNTPEGDGSFTLTLQVPGNRVEVIRNADPGFLFIRIVR